MISCEPMEFSSNWIRDESDTHDVHGFDHDHSCDYWNLYGNLDFIELQQRATLW